MKVICIDGEWVDKSIPGPKFGDIDYVIEDSKDEGILWYVLERFPDYQYESAAFSPISSIDETTFERNYQKETV